MAQCSIEDCWRPAYCRGWCRPHYRRWERTGNPSFDEDSRYGPQTEPEFWSRFVRLPTGCWEWSGYITKTGYGRTRFGGRMVLTHRLAYELAIGPIPDGLTLDHLCRNRACGNPDHLEPVTSAENTRRGDHTNMGVRKREQTHCIRGHKFTEANTYRRPDGRRRCRTCAREADRERRKR